LKREKTGLIWETLPEQEKESWPEKASTMHDWVVCQHQNGSEQRSRFMLGSERCHCLDKTNGDVVDNSEGVGRKKPMSNTTDRYRVGILDGHRDQQIRRLRLLRHSHSMYWIQQKRGGNESKLCESVGKEENTAEEGGTRRGRIQLEPSRTSGLCLGITRHPYDKTRALFARQPSTAESFEKMSRRRRKSDVCRNANRRHFMGSD